MIFCAVNQTKIIVVDRLDLGIRTARYDLHRIPAVSCILRDLKERVFKEQILFCRVIPVKYKPHCKRCHSGALDAQMRVTPVAELLVPAKVFPSHIEAAHKSDPAIYDHDLPVITVIHTELQLTQQCREKLCHLNPLVFQALPVFILHSPASHTVKQYAHFHTFPGFLDKDFLNLLPEFIISYNIILHMDITFCLTHLLDECAELLFTVRIYPDIIIVGEDGLARFKIIEDQILKAGHLGISKPQALVVDRFLLTAHSIFQFPFYLFRLKHPAFVKILSDHQIHDESEYRYKIKQKKPCPYRLRRSPLKKHDDQCKEDINDNDVVHDKVIDRHHSVPNHFCHKSNSFFISVFPHPLFVPTAEDGPPLGDTTITVYSVLPRKVNPKPLKCTYYLALVLKQC